MAVAAVAAALRLRVVLVLMAQIGEVGSLSRWTPEVTWLSQASARQLGFAAHWMRLLARCSCFGVC